MRIQVEVGELGHRLLSELCDEELNSSAASLSVFLPRLPNYAFIGHLIKVNYVRESANIRNSFQLYSKGVKKRPVEIICSNDVPLAELWPSHVAYIKESPHMHWEVPTERGSVVMHSLAEGGSRTCYFLRLFGHM